MPQTDPILPGTGTPQDNVMMMWLVRIEAAVPVASQDNALAKSFDGAWENRSGKAFRQHPASSYEQAVGPQHMRATINR